MRLQASKAGEVIAAWVDQELTPKASGLQKVATVMGSILLARKAPEMIGRYADVLRALDMLDENGRIRLEELRDLASEAMQKTGKVNVSGILIGPDDVQSLYDVAARFADNE